MILFVIKLFTTIRRAVAGRRYPYQLAWAVAFGLLLGIIPHGNLLAIALLVVVLSLRLNHATAGLTAIGVSFAAPKLDPYSHEVGNFVLAHPKVIDVAQTAWALPLVPWTDLNNTIVMGSFLIGLAALLPTFLITYPIFRWLAPIDAIDETVDAAEPIEDTQRERHPGATTASTSDITVGGKPHPSVPQPKMDRMKERIEFVEVDHPVASASPVVSASSVVSASPVVSARPSHPADHRVAVETRVDVIRLSEPKAAAASDEGAGTTAESNQQQPMDEALNYLLRQLRDSQQRKSA